jgi:hypothetical protein
MQQQQQQQQQQLYGHAGLLTAQLSHPQYLAAASGSSLPPTPFRVPGSPIRHGSVVITVAPNAGPCTSAPKPPAPAALWAGACTPPGVPTPPPAPLPAQDEDEGGWVDALLGPEPPLVPSPASALIAHAADSLAGGNGAPQPPPQPGRPGTGSDSDSDHFHTDFGDLLDMPALRSAMLGSAGDEEFAPLCGLTPSHAAGGAALSQAGWGLESPRLF